MIIKVCGMREPKNIEALQQLDIDFMGIIKYPKSKRFVDQDQSLAIEQLTMNKGTVGVYVNASMQEILNDIIPLQLDVVQLHGDEDPAFAKALLELDLKIFKAFQISTDYDFDNLRNWESLATEYPGKFFFLFDTATKHYGGSGKKFNWSILENYTGNVPFILSGGIGPKDATNLKNLNHEMLLGVDLNSQFEISPGKKNIKTIKQFIKELRNE
ncbi:phosphoribosylanthranilate isomerase [Nonlabens tegetincola]|uniref:phosphoribosylanthranilate isomerase n=1 Tax=Nonlabens tegetincola TaxID=323273 RepID=UPI000CF38087|nr:phosphoribosylanthranilate isomerase [Nonlabens tegetincola]PQJ19287.1 N-(5'-phosphoribosyl)anthranilate isomerase [Nonlabens tegetincola]